MQPYAQPPMQAPPSHRPPRRGVPIPAAAIGGGLLLFLGIGVGATGSGGGGDTAAPEVTVTKTVTAHPKAVAAPAKSAPAGPATSFGDGTYSVGKEIKAGTYKAPGGDHCYWERLRNFDGELNSILANGSPSGVVRVTIKTSDFGFKTDGCGTWKRV